jgi:uncharacterized protein (DUF1800 family)
MSLSRRKFLRLSGTTVGVSAVSGCRPFPGPWSSNQVSLQNGPFEVPASSEIDAIIHVLNRLSWGIAPGEYERVRRLAADPFDAANAYIEEQLFPEQLDDSAAETMLRRFEVLSQPRGELFEYKEDFLLNQLVLATVLRAALSRRQLYETMVQFWTDHFNVDPSKGDCRWLKAWDDREVIRRYALGDAGPRPLRTLAQGFKTLIRGSTHEQRSGSAKFPDLLRASALSPAMLWYLDGRENRITDSQSWPNENYARELLELHTLGVHGGYTQQDVMEVARCLTGWTVRGRGGFAKGKVEFQPEFHDDGAKVVLGQPIPSGLGPHDLDRVLDIVGLHPSTARHLATKLCRRFISDPPPPEAIPTVSRAFLGSGGDIQTTLRALFQTPAFLSARGVKFKRPFHFVIAALRTTNARLKPDRHLVEFLERMGHVPFHCPTPDGYPSEPEPWIGSLLWRWNFAVTLQEDGLNGARIDLAALMQNAGGDENLMAHVLGRRPTASERRAYHDSGAGLALLLASPGFQKF